MKKAVHEVSLQRVYMRNEMFKEPLTNQEIESVVASHTPNRSDALKVDHG
jgi:hypothetical protein